MGKKVDVGYSMRPKMLIEVGRLRELLELVQQVEPGAYIGLDEDTESLGIYNAPIPIASTYLFNARRLGRVLLEEERVSIDNTEQKYVDELPAIDPLELLRERKETTRHLHGGLLD